MTKGKFYLLVVVGSLFSSLVIIAVFASMMGRGPGAGKSEGGKTPGEGVQSSPAVTPGQPPEDAKDTYRGRPGGYWVQRLQDANEAVRLEAAGALAKLGARNPEQVPPLIAALK